jgi:hypothetical protein
MLAVHPDVATASEPWLLLPLFYCLGSRPMVADYNHRFGREAIRDLLDRMNGGEAAFRGRLADLALSVYEDLAHGAPWFIDKTPRYHLIADEIIRTFPDGRFIFLWRNPLAVVSSILRTFHQDRWVMHRWTIDLYDGWESLVETYRRHQDDPRVVALRYEDLVHNPARSAKRLACHIGVTFSAAMIHDFRRVKLDGPMGDPTGIGQYQSIDAAPLAKWPATFSNPWRRSWARRYLEWAGRERLALTGYDPDELRELLAAQRGVRRSGRDVWDRAKSCLAPWIEPYLLRRKLAARSESRRFHIHE